MSDRDEHKGELSHVDNHGNASMVDVGDKSIQKRFAEASGLIKLAPETIKAVRKNQVKKGDVLAVARIAGIQAAKATPTLIPLCHILPLDSVHFNFDVRENSILASCQVSCQARTGVEMEALTGVTVALLTIYDMCKAIDKKMLIEDIRLIKKLKEDLPG